MKSNFISSTQFDVLIRIRNQKFVQFGAFLNFSSLDILWFVFICLNKPSTLVLHIFVFEINLTQVKIFAVIII